MDGSARELIYNGILPERNYTVEVRGYVHRLGPANATIVRLEGIQTQNVNNSNKTGTFINHFFY